MFINENINVSDSAIFMGFMRQSLIESLKENNADDAAIEYVSESASDAQVLSLAMYGKSCPDDNPVYGESVLISQLKDYILENVNDFDFDNNYSCNDFFQEIGGLSLVETDSLSIFQERDWQKFANDVGGAAKMTYRQGKKAVEKNINSRPKQDLKPNSLLGNVDVDKDVKTYKPGKSPMTAINNSLKRKDFGDMGGVSDNIEALEQSKRAKKVKNLSRNVPDTVKKAHDVQINQGNQSDTNVPDQSAPSAPKAATTPKAATAPEGGLMGMLHRAGDNIGKAWSTFNTFTGGHGKAIGITALVGASAFIAYKAYKNYFSKAAKACAGKSGAEKQACMAKAKQQGQKAKITALKKSMRACKNTTNPNKCKQQIQAKISSMSR